MFFPLNVEFKLIPVSEGSKFLFKDSNTDPQTLDFQVMWVTD